MSFLSRTTRVVSRGRHESDLEEFLNVRRRRNDVVRNLTPENLTTRNLPEGSTAGACFIQSLPHLVDLGTGRRSMAVARPVERLSDHVYQPLWEYLLKG